METSQERPDVDVCSEIVGKSAVQRRQHIQQFCEQLISESNMVMELKTDRVFMYSTSEKRYVHVDDETLKRIIKRKFTRMALTPALKVDIVDSIKDMLWNGDRHQIDADSDIICAKNGVYNIATGELYKHSPEFLSSVQINANISRDFQKTKDRYEGGVFDKFMWDFTGGNDEVKEMLLRFFGLAISNIPGYKTKKALFLVSEKGNTGKSLIKNVICDLVGEEHIANIDLRSLEGRWGAGMCYKKRIVGSSDQSVMSIAELPVFKQMTGGDLMYAERKYENGFSYKYEGVIFCCANRLPSFGGDKGEHVYDRFLIYEPKRSVPYEEQDSALYDKIMAERDYIAVLCIEALQRLIADRYRFNEPKDVQASRMKYRKDNNSFVSFCEECVVPLNRKPNGFDGEALLRPISIKTFFDTYKAWAQVNNYGNMLKRKDAMKVLKDAGLGDSATYHGFEYFTRVTIQEKVYSQFLDDRIEARLLSEIPKGDGWCTDIDKIILG